MEAVEKEGMKLYDGLSKTKTSESARLQGLMEDFGNMGVN